MAGLLDGLLTSVSSTSEEHNAARTLTGRIHAACSCAVPRLFVPPSIDEGRPTAVRAKLNAHSCKRDGMNMPQGENLVCWVITEKVCLYLD